MQYTRPRALIAPLQLGLLLGVQMHSHFLSRFAVDTLHEHRFCSSYDEVQTFEKSAAIKQGIQLPVEATNFAQYVVDNADHNIRTIDRHGTFHGMGIIATIAPEAKSTRA